MGADCPQLSMLHGHYPCNIIIREKNYLMENVNIKWTMSMLHGQLTPDINTESFKMTIKINDYFIPG